MRLTQRRLKIFSQLKSAICSKLSLWERGVSVFTLAVDAISKANKSSLGIFERLDQFVLCAKFLATELQFSSVFNFCLAREDEMIRRDSIAAYNPNLREYFGKVYWKRQKQLVLGLSHQVGRSVNSLTRKC